MHLVQIIRIHGIDADAAVHSPNQLLPVLVRRLHKEGGGAGRMTGGKLRADSYASHYDGLIVVVEMIHVIGNDLKAGIMHIGLRTMAPVLILFGKVKLRSRHFL